MSFSNNTELLMYQTEDGQTKIEVRMEDETVWLTQAQMAELFQTSKQNVSLHISNIFKEGELNEISVVKEYLTTAIYLMRKLQSSFFKRFRIKCIGQPMVIQRRK